MDVKIAIGLYENLIEGLKGNSKNNILIYIYECVIDELRAYPIFKGTELYPLIDKKMEIIDKLINIFLNEDVNYQIDGDFANDLLIDTEIDRYLKLIYETKIHRQINFGRFISDNLNSDNYKKIYDLYNDCIYVYESIIGELKSYKLYYIINDEFIHFSLIQKINYLDNIITTNLDSIESIKKLINLVN